MERKYKITINLYHKEESETITYNCKSINDCRETLIDDLMEIYTKVDTRYFMWNYDIKYKDKIIQPFTEEEIDEYVGTTLS